MDLESIFTEQEKAALSLLTKAGFQVFSEAQVEETRELEGKRLWTFKNEGRYDLVLALKSATDIKRAAPLKATRKPKK